MPVLQNQEDQNRKIYKIPSLKENFGISRDQFDDLVQRLKIGDDSFITNHLCFQLSESIKYLQNRFGISKEYAYDVCMDTFLDFRAKLIQNKIEYGNLRFLYSRMCVNQYLDQKKKSVKVDSAISQFLVSSRNDSGSKETFFANLERAIQMLSKENIEILKEIFYSGKSLDKIAEERDISYAALRKRKERLLLKLKKTVSTLNS